MRKETNWFFVPLPFFSALVCARAMNKRLPVISSCRVSIWYYYSHEYDDFFFVSSQCPSVSVLWIFFSVLEDQFSVCVVGFSKPRDVPSRLFMIHECVTKGRISIISLYCRVAFPLIPPNHTSLFGSSYTPILDNFHLHIPHPLQISSPYPPPSKPNLTINDQSHFSHLNQPNGGSRTSSYVPVSLTFISLTILPWSRFIDIRCLFIIAVVWNLDGCYFWSRKWSDIVITLWSPLPIQMMLFFSSASYYLAPNGFDISHANLLNISSHCRGYILFNATSIE